MPFYSDVQSPKSAHQLVRSPPHPDGQVLGRPGLRKRPARAGAIFSSTHRQVDHEVRPATARSIRCCQ